MSLFGRWLEPNADQLLVAGAVLEKTIKSDCPTLAEIRGDSLFSWEWDDRFSAHLSTVEQAQTGEALHTLESRFPLRFDKKTAKKASRQTKKAIQEVGGLQKNQFYFNRQEAPPQLLYCIWWPWQSDERVSVRIGYHLDNIQPSDQDDVCRAFRVWLDS